jgi:hypothetical protein
MRISDDERSGGSMQPPDYRRPRLFLDDDHFARSAEVERHPGRDSREPEDLPGVRRIAGEQGDAVRRDTWKVILGGCNPGSARCAS